MGAFRQQGGSGEEILIGPHRVVTMVTTEAHMESNLQLLVRKLLTQVIHEAVQPFPIGLHTPGARSVAHPPVASTLASRFTLRRCRVQTFLVTRHEVFLIPAACFYTQNLF